MSMVAFLVAAAVTVTGAAFAIPAQLPTIPDSWSPIGIAVAISLLIGAFIKYGAHRTAGLQISINELEDSNDRLKADLAAERQRSAVLEQVVEAERVAKEREYLRAQRYWRLIVLHRDIIPGADEALHD